jgi:hypothetical protein
MRGGGMSQAELCSAIRAQRLVRFFYSLDDEPGFRTVEPHMVARTKTEALALSAWYLSGASESNQGPGWRTYLLSGISQVTILNEGFDGPRPGYKPDGGKSFHDVQCGLL